MDNVQVVSEALSKLGQRSTTGKDRFYYQVTEYKDGTGKGLISGRLWIVRSVANG